MIIYGVALLSACFLAGLWVGELLGELLGVNANVGGVGFAMLALMIISERRTGRCALGAGAQQGVSFWTAMYIPIVFAMAAKQNVIAAIGGGFVALLAGTAAVAGSLVAVPLLARLASARVKDDPAS
ncbi:MAG: malonate transporter subunit MadL [Amphiplicatus sp.]